VRSSKQCHAPAKISGATVLAASSSKSFLTLSKLSLPDYFSGLPSMEELAGVEITPKSKGV
jgi:hypothetical protein